MIKHSEIPFNNDNIILATKRAWRKGDTDRRLKDGSINDRKLTADIIKMRRLHDIKVKEIERKSEYSAFMVAVCVLLGLVVILFWPHKAHAEGIPLKASWYSIESLKREGTYKHSKGVMANGHIFRDNNYTCATRLFPLGSILRIQERTYGRCVNVTVTDRIGKRFAKQRIDLSRKAFETISSLNKGLVNVNVELIK